MWGWWVPWLLLLAASRPRAYGWRSRGLEEDVCFEISMSSELEDTRWNATYTVLTSAGEFVSSGTMDARSSEEQSDTVCLVEVPMCVVIEVRATDGVRWTVNRANSSRGAGLGYFRVLEDGDVVATDECSVSQLPVPAPTSSTRCFPFVMTDTSGDGWGGGYYHVYTVDGETLTVGTMEEGSFEYTRSICVDGTTKECFVIEVVAGVGSDEVGWSMGGGALSGGAPASPRTFRVLSGGQVVVASCTSSPTNMPTTSAPTLYFEIMPTTLEDERRSAVAETFADLERAILEMKAREITIGSPQRILFTDEIEIAGKSLAIEGVNGTATLDGDYRTRLFRLSRESVLSLSNLILKNGFVDADDGGLIYLIESSRVDLSACVVDSCYAGSSGGAFFLRSSELNAEHSTFSNNTGRFSGGVAWTTFSSTANFVNCTAFENSAEEEGGFAFVTTSSVVTSLDSTFKRHHSFAGAVVLVEGGIFTAQRSDFNANFGANGAVFANGEGSLVLHNCTFVSNVASERGGVMAVIRDGTAEIVDCTMESNNATLFGGVVFSLSGHVRAERSRFVSNYAEGDGGVVDAFSATMDYESCVFESNRAGVAGGAISSSLSTTTLLRSTFDLNIAGTAGALNIEESSAADVIECTFTSNSAVTAGGGAVLVGHGSSLQMYDSTLSGNTANNASSSNFLDCQVSSTLYVAKTTLDSSQNFDLATTCVLYFYLANNDGSREFEEAVLDHVLSTTGTIDNRYWTHPCSAGEYSSDGLEHGDTPAYEDRNGQTIDFNDPFCEPEAPQSSILRCSPSCEPCPRGTYSEFSLDRYSLASVNSCKRCSIGRYLADDGTDALLHDSKDDCTACPPGKFGNTVGAYKCDQCPIGKYAPTPESTFCVPAEPGSFVMEAGASQTVECPAGKFSVAEAADCRWCSPGTYQPMTAQTTCSLARPGYFVNGTGETTETPCPPGTVSAGSGSTSCVPCNPGEYQPNEGRSSCFLASPGHSASGVAAFEEIACKPGEFSASGAAICSECEIGRYARDEMNSDCRTCPAPMNTTRPGSIYCDACAKDYFFDTVHWEKIGRKEWNSTGAQCVDCCVKCHDEGMVCKESGTELLTLEIESGWWRSTSRSKEVYKCDLEDACDGGNSTYTDQQCSDGHEGALCGACGKNFEYSNVRNKCVQCGDSVHILGSAGSIFLVSLMVVMSLVLWLKRFGSQHHWHALSGLVSMVAKDEISSGADTGREFFSDGRTRYGLDREESKCEELLDVKEEQREKLWRSVLTKVKIVVATWQIAGSTQWVLTQVNFPSVYENVTRTLGAIGVNYFDIFSVGCLLDNWTYFDKLVFATVLPFAVIVIFISVYLGAWKVCHRNAFHRDRGRVLANAIYGTLLILYVALPGASSWTFSYFNCVRYDRGDGRKPMIVLMTDPSVKCTSPRYDAWFPYVVISCIVWPVGMPLGVGILLWSNRHRLNPPNVDKKFIARSSSLEEVQKHAFQREKDRHQVAMQQLAKLDVRDNDTSLRSLQFVFEEYEPRCFMFPVFEILRRIFLTAMLMAFYPGSMAQVVVGLTASMISFAVYNHYEPYIEDDDDAVSAVAQTQLTLVYFASFVVYSSERLEKKEGVFSSDAFGSFLILLFLTSFFVAVWTVLLELWGYSTVVDRIDATRKSLSQTLRTSLRSLMSTQDSSNSIDVDESGSTNPSPRESADSDRSSMPFNHSGVSDEKDGEVGERKSEEIECADTSPCDEGSALERSSSRLDYHLYMSKEVSEEEKRPSFFSIQSSPEEE